MSDRVYNLEVLVNADEGRSQNWHMQLAQAISDLNDFINELHKPKDHETVLEYYLSMKPVNFRPTALSEFLMLRTDQWTNNAVELYFDKFIFEFDNMARALPFMLRSGMAFNDIYGFVKREIENMGSSWYQTHPGQGTIESLISGELSEMLSDEQRLVLIDHSRSQDIVKIFNQRDVERDMSAFEQKIIERDLRFQIGALSSYANKSIRNYANKILEKTENFEINQETLLELSKEFLYSGGLDIRALQLFYDHDIKLSKKFREDSLYKFVDLAAEEPVVQFLIDKKESFNRNNGNMVSCRDFSHSRMRESTINSLYARKANNLVQLLRTRDSDIFDVNKWIEGLKKVKNSGLKGFIQIAKRDSGELRDELEKIGFFDDQDIVAYLNSDGETPDVWKVVNNSFREDLSYETFIPWIRETDENLLFSDKLYPMEEWLDYAKSEDILEELARRNDGGLSKWIKFKKDYYQRNQQDFYSFVHNINDINKKKINNEIKRVDIDTLRVILDNITNLNYKFYGISDHLLLKMMSMDYPQKEMSQILDYLDGRGFTIDGKRSNGQYLFNHYYRKSIIEHNKTKIFKRNDEAIYAILLHADKKSIDKQIYQDMLDFTAEISKPGEVIDPYYYLRNFEVFLNNRGLNIPTKLMRTFRDLKERKNLKSRYVSDEDKAKVYGKLIMYHKGLDIKNIKVNTLWEIASKLDDETLLPLLIDSEIKMPTEAGMNNVMDNQKDKKQSIIKKALLTKEVGKEKIERDEDLGL